MQATDAHAHVFRHDLAFAAGRRYTPPYDATLADYLAMLERSGSARGVLVQPSFLGSNNGFMLAALAAEPRRLRGVAVVAPTIPAADMDALAAGGIVGVRLNLIGCADPDFCTSPWPAHLREVVRRGWHVEVQAEAARIPALLPPLLEAGARVVVDHFGLPDAALGADDPGFRALCGLARSGALWVKLSGAYRLGPDGVRHAAAAAPLLLAAFGPRRLLWGSDWPHTQHEDEADPVALRAAFEAWVPDAVARATILVETPAELFGF